MSECAQSDTSYVNWLCIPIEKKLCQLSLLRWEVLHDLIMQQNVNVTIQMMSSKKKQTTYMTKHGKKEKFKAKLQATNIYFILNILNGILPKIIYHHNYFAISVTALLN